MAKITIDDICNDIVECKHWTFNNGFFYNSLGELMSREELRSAIAFRFSRHKVDDIDKFEETITEFCKNKNADAREIFINSIMPKKSNKKCWLLEYLKEEYPNYNWDQIFYDIIMQKSERVYILHGVARAGKSKFIELLQHIFGDYAKPMTINQLSNKFNLGEVIGKLLIIGDDLGGKESFGEVIGLIKSMATGQPISMERKFMHSIPCRNEANFVFGTNSMPYLDINDDGVLRRFVVINFTKKMKLPVNNYKQFMREYIQNDEQCDALLYHLSTIEYDPEYFEELSFYSQVYLIENSPVAKAKTNDYDTYANYCKSKGFKPMNSENWARVKETQKQLENKKANFKPKQQCIDLIPIDVEDDSLPF